ncbi:MAG: hypothetical protein WBX81_09430, partial [Nitrososphaeraceae archaeon]
LSRNYHYWFPSSILIHANLIIYVLIDLLTDEIVITDAIKFVFQRKIAVKLMIINHKLFQTEPSGIF